MFGRHKKKEEYREELSEHEKYRHLAKHPRNMLGGNMPNPYAKLGGTQGKVTRIAKKSLYIK